MLAAFFREITRHVRPESADDGFRHRCEDRAALVAVRHAAQQLNAALKLSVVRPPAGDVQHVLVIVRLFERGLEFFRQLPRVGRLEEIEREDIVEEVGMPAQPFREVRRIAHDFRDELQELRIRVEQRK